MARAEIFVTTKLWLSEYGYDKALRAFDSSLRKLALDYIAAAPEYACKGRAEEIASAVLWFCSPGAGLRTTEKRSTRLHSKEEEMKDEPTNARKSFGDIAPHLAEITDKVLFGDVWESTSLSPRDRSLVTITSLISLYRINEMPFHFMKALDNGVTREEIIGAITHLAFYAGWPPAMTALAIARKVFVDDGSE